MPRPRKWPPTIHTVNGRDYLRIDGRTLFLGATGSPAAMAEYARWLKVLSANGGRLPVEDAGDDLTVSEGVTAFLRWAEGRYGGTREFGQFVSAARPLVRLFGSESAKTFGPKRLKEVRAALAEHYCRKTANDYLGRVKRVFKWLQSEEMLPPGTYHDLLSVPGVARGEGRDGEPVLPVPEEDFARTLPFLNPVVRAAVEVQLLTACRPGELLALRPCDLIRGGAATLSGGLRVSLGPCWLYRPAAHKTAHHGHARLIIVGPQAQAVLAPFLANRAEDAYLFSPREARALQNADKRARRKTKVQPSQVSRKKANPKKKAGERYTVGSYNHAIRDAVRKAGVPHWHPHQLRHNAASRLCDQFGPEVARIVLGHRTFDVTRIYVADNLNKAVEAMAQAG